MALAAALGTVALVLGLASADPAIGQARGPVDAGAVTRAADAASTLPRLALMGTVPIYWGEAGELADLVQGSGQTHWARAQLEAGFALVPLDRLDAAALAGEQRLLLAQPRTLSPAENVALDEWVRGGGRVLLFADPLMTGESHYGVGDRRRPQDVTLLSPLLMHWGLDLQLDDAARPGLTVGDAGVARLPVNVPGQLVALPGTSCTVLGQGLAASCSLGMGRALVVADAAVLDLAGPWPGAPQGLAALVESAFGDSGQNADEGGGA